MLMIEFERKEEDRKFSFFLKEKKIHLVEK